MDDFSLFLGSWHPLLVHLPIGMLIMAFLLEWFARKEKYAAFGPAVAPVLLAGSISAILSCIAGYFLSLGGGYNPSTLGWHKWLGIAVALIATIAWITKRFPDRIPFPRSFQFPLLILLMLLLTAAGHYGGTLTHGSGYLTKALPGPARELLGISAPEEAEIPVITNVQEAAVFDDVIRPVLATRCTSCHGADKMKGDLRLDTREMILKGGESGPVLEAGVPEDSELLRRLLLPEGHDDHMPPKGRTQLSSQQVQLIHWWVSEGAPFEGAVKEVKQSDSIKPLLAALEADADGNKHAFIPEGELPDPAPETAIAPLLERGVKVMPVAQGSPYLQVSCINDTSFSDTETALLLPLKAQLVWLDLAGTQVTDKGLENLAGLEVLTRLHLSHTEVGDQGLSYLSACKQLAFLNLFNTPVTDNGLPHLQNIPSLKEVHLYKTAISSPAAAQLVETHPELVLDTGNYHLPLLAADTIQF